MKRYSWLAALASAVTLAWIGIPAQADAASVAGRLAAAKPNPHVQLATWYGRRHHYRPYRWYYYGPRYRHRHYHYYYGPRSHRRGHWRNHRYW